MNAVILCGGQGTRLAPVWNGPKSLVPVGPRPFLHWQLDRLEQAGFTKATLLTGSGHDAISLALRSWSGEMSVETRRDPLLVPPGSRWGTGSAVREFAATLRDPFLLLYGDVYPRGDISAPLRMGRAGRCVLTVSRSTIGNGNCKIEKGRVVDYGVKSQWLEAGCMCLWPRYFQVLSPLYRSDLPDWLHTFARAHIVDALEVPASLDVGYPDGLEKARKELLKREA